MLTREKRMGFFRWQISIHINKEYIMEKFKCLEITNVQTYIFKENGGLGHIKGMATIVFNDQFQVRGLRIMDGANGLFIGWPNDPFYKGDDFRSLCNPVTRELREKVENTVLAAYQERLQQLSEDKTA